MVRNDKYMSLDLTLLFEDISLVGSVHIGAHVRQSQKKDETQISSAKSALKRTNDNLPAQRLDVKCGHWIFPLV